MKKDDDQTLSLDSPEVEAFLAEPAPQAPLDAGADPLDSPEVNEFIAPIVKQEKYGSGVQQAIAGVEGVGQGLLGPVIPAIEKELGVPEEDILGRREMNPATHLAGEAVGLVGPALLTGGASAGARGALATASKFTQAGLLEAVGKKIAIGAGDTLASKIGTAAARGAIENALIAGSDETSKMILNDPNQSAESAVANIGLAGVIGGGLSGSVAGATGTLGNLWKATMGSRAGKLVEDFQGRIKQHIDTPDPVSAVSSELGDYYKGITSTADEVFGAQGVKAADIAKALPEVNPAMQQQASELAAKAQKTLDSLGDDPLARKLAAELDKYKAKISEAPSHPILGAEVTPKSSGELFDAAQSFKQQLQEWGKFNKNLAPVAEHDFRNAAKSLAYDLRTSLEDPKIWGKAAERQKAINKAFSEYLPTLKDFNKRFTVEINGERVIDPAKISTYLNQLDNPKAEIKKEMLKNFLDASERYKKVIDDSHVNLGIEPPLINSPMNAVMGTLDKKTLGGQLADAFIDRGLKGAGGEGLGASVGGGLGAMVGGPMGASVGAILGAKALGPLFSTILPALSKALVENPKAAAGLKASVDYILKVAKGNETLGKAIKDTFSHAPGLAMNFRIPSEKELDRLDKVIAESQKNPTALFNRDSEVSKYLPNHSIAVDATMANAITYLNSLRPDTSKKSPLDSTPVPSAAQKAAYKNALMIAQQPLIVLDKIKQGRLTTNDMKALSAMYPALYVSMQSKMMDQMAASLNKGENIPYKARISMSMFMTQALDSTMLPGSIQATQGVSQTGKNLTQPQQQPKGTKSSPALQKMSSLYQTPEQTRQKRQQTQ